MFQGLTGWHALIILAVVVLLFRATKLPALAKSVGQSMKIFRSEMKSTDDEDKGQAGTDSSGQAKNSNDSQSSSAS